MPDSRRAEPFKSRALDFATVDSQPRAANTYNNFPANPVARGGESLISNNTSAALAGTRPTRSPATKALLLIDNVTLTRECLTHLLTTELKGFRNHQRRASPAGSCMRRFARCRPAQDEKQAAFRRHAA